MLIIIFAKDDKHRRLLLSLSPISRMKMKYMKMDFHSHEFNILNTNCPKTSREMRERI